MVWVLEVEARAILLEKRGLVVQEEDPKEVLITDRKFEMNELCGVFIGKWGKLSFSVGLFVYMTTGLWSFGSVFGISLTSKIPILSSGPCNMYEVPLSSGCHETYLIYMAIFAAVVVPLSCLELKEQISIQVTLCLCRFLVVGFMILTILVYVIQTGRMTVDPDPSHSFKDFVDFSGFASIFTTSIYAQLFHHSVPVLAHPITNKTHLRPMFICGLLTTMSLYIIIGLTASFFFGNLVQPLVTLNWEFYTGHDFPLSPSSASRPWWAIFISYYIMLFPALDVVSGFPLGAIILGNAIFASLPPSFQERYNNRFVKSICRTIAALPPLICATLAWNLSKILEIGKVNSI